MAELCRGSAHLSARTILHHPRVVPGVSPCIIFDATVRGILGDEPMLCSLRYELQFPGDRLLPGAYDIVAKVSEERLPSRERRVTNDNIFIGRNF